MVGSSGDEHGRYLYVNRAFCEMVGYTREALLDMDVAALTHPDDRADSGRLMDELTAGQIKQVNIEKRYVRADGSTLWVEISGSTMRDAHGRPFCHIAHVQDITVRKEHERERELLSAIVDSSDDAIFSKTLDGTITSWNPGAERLYGFTAAEACGSNIGELIVPPSIAGDDLGIIRQVQAGESVDHYETLRRRKDDRLVEVSLTASPIKDENGQIVGVAVIGRDISEQKRRERSLLADAEAYGWLQRVRSALDDDQFVLHSQPIVDMSTGAVTREEVLLRMRGGRGEEDVIGPGLFLPVAEKFDLIGDIDRWVLAESIPLLAGDRAVGVNLSGRSIGDPSITKLIEHLVGELDVDPSKLTIEITETALVEDLQAARVFTDKLERLGCTLALDDFGTGYGSFTYLRHLPVQFLKIDIQFIRGLVHSPADRQIVRSMVGVARGFGMKTVAEGVEDEATLDLLGDFGIDFAQGFHLGRPAPVESAQPLVSAA